MAGMAWSACGLLAAERRLDEPVPQRRRTVDGVKHLADLADLVDLVDLMAGISFSSWSVR
ncbi:hypothetical protein [Herbidospora cretacea]|uniref:hypothetical protein n=1 Tax=Herbidospora cretacea TaxID=28444 RepID=UPI000B025D18|nr:hypothetical protein [Herbidospora cretacea]